MAEIQIYDMATNATPNDDDFFEQDIVDLDLPAGRNNKKISLGAVSNFVAKTHNYTSDLQTTNKTIVGAINEVLNEGTSVSVTNVLPATETTKRVATITVDDVAKDVNADDADKILRQAFGEHTVTGNPVSFDAFLGLEVPSVAEVSFSPIQDLHGYDNPWVGGAGKNKLPMTLAGIKSANTSGTWSGNAYTVNGVTFTINTDSDDNVIGITANNTASSTAILILAENFSAFSADVILNGCPSGGSNSTYRVDYNGGIGADVGSGVTITAGTSFTNARIRIASGYSASNVKFYPMIRLSTVTDDTFAPYSNICPISGWTGVEVYGNKSRNLFDNTDTESGYLNNQGEIAGGNPWCHSFIPICPNTYITVSGCNSNSTPKHCWYDENMNFISVFSNHENGTFLSPSNAKFAGVCAIIMSNTSHDLDTMQVEFGQSATAYTSYQKRTCTSTFGQTVYGGKVDFVSGVATLTHAILDMGAQTYTYDSNNRFTFSAVLNYKYYENVRTAVFLCSCFQNIHDGRPLAQVPDGSIYSHQATPLAVVNFYIHDSRYTDPTTFKTAMSGQTICYELATPTEITLTPQDIELLKGQNVLWTDGDSIKLTYSADIKAWVLAQLNA